MPLWGSRCEGFHVALKHSLYSFDGLKKNRPNECKPVPPLKHTDIHGAPSPNLNFTTSVLISLKSSMWLHTGKISDDRLSPTSAHLQSPS